MEANLKELLMTGETLIYLLQIFGIPNQHSKFSIELHNDFGIFRIGIKFSRHDIESSKRENFKNSARMHRLRDLEILGQRLTSVKTLSKLIGRFASTAVASLPPSLT